tara:strand:- start:232 stop:438 length:207 start_codon:yes stop_codon:yes gene_type:complete
MKIFINGEVKELDENQSSLEKFIEILGYHPKLIVIELNGRILPPSKWHDQELKDNDSLEIVTIVGGGS